MSGGNGWRTPYKLALAAGTLLPLLGGLVWLAARVQAVAQLPAKIDALRIAHDTQTAVLRAHLQLDRCLVIYGREGCVALARQADP